MISTGHSEQRSYKKGIFHLALILLLMTLLLMSMVSSAQAAQKLNIYLDKEALLACDMPAEDIRIRPEDMVRVTRHALWPWDEAGTKWSMFVEIENTSDEKIVIDEDWLVACKGNRDEIETADYIFDYTTNRFDPGEKIVLYAGAYPYAQTKRTQADATLDTWDVEGMSDFAARIRQAQILRVRLETRGDESSQNWRAVPIEPKVWIEGRTIHFEWTNTTEETLGFRTIGAVKNDEADRIIDVICLTHSRGAVAAPSETLAFEKTLSPYISQQMIDDASFDTFAFAFPRSM